VIFWSCGWKFGRLSDHYGWSLWLNLWSLCHYCGIFHSQCPTGTLGNIWIKTLLRYTAISKIISNTQYLQLCWLVTTVNEYINYMKQASPPPSILGIAGRIVCWVSCCFSRTVLLTLIVVTLEQALGLPVTKHQHCLLLILDDCILAYLFLIRVVVLFDALL
jgi:hypothetical protein